MDIKQLQYFAMACEHGSFSAAAACMYTSQPNVSRSVRELEHELGRELFVRGGKGVQLTSYGKNVLEHARIILKTTATISSLAAPDEKSRLSLSTYPSNMIARLLVQFYEVWGSDYHIEHQEGTVEEIINHVCQGISEFGLVYVAQKQVSTFQHILSHKKLNFCAMDTKKLCVFVGVNHPLYRSRSVDFSDLSNLKFVGGVRDFFSMEHHLETVSLGVIDTRSLNYVAYTNSDYLTVNLLLHADVCSLGLDFMYRSYEQYDIKPLEINGCEPFLQLGYVYAPDIPLSSQANWLIEAFRKRL